MTQKRNLEKEVKELITEVDATHRYSMSQIYGLYNEVFGKEEKAQACASCLKRKLGELKKWLAEKEAVKAEKPKAEKPKQKVAKKKSDKVK